MAKHQTLRVSTKGFDPIRVAVLLPESLEDPRWNEIVADRSLINTLAVRGWRVAAQEEGRVLLRQGASEEAVANAVKTYVFTGKKATPAKKFSKDVVAKLRFTPEQVAELRKLGYIIE